MSGGRWSQVEKEKKIYEKKDFEMVVDKDKTGRASLLEIRHQLRSLIRLSNGKILYQWYNFMLIMLSVHIQPIFQKFNSCVTKGRRKRRTDEQTD